MSGIAMSLNGDWNTEQAVRTLWFETALGRCGVSWREPAAGLTAFHLPDAHAGDTSRPGAVRDGGSGSSPPTAFAELIARVQNHLAGRSGDFTGAPLDWTRATTFQRAVYEATWRCRAGETWTYGRLAREAGHPGGARAVGVALGQNPWPLLVPCHRFVGAGGKMTGFSGPGGIETKLRLLALERAQLFPV